MYQDTKEHVGELQEKLTCVEFQVRLSMAREETGGAARNQAIEGLVSHTKEFCLYPVGVRIVEAF